jgi:hypothetical protein
VRPYSIRYTIPAVEGLLGLTKRSAASIHRALVARAADHPMPTVPPVMRDDDGHDIFRVFLPRVAVEYWIDHAVREWVVTDIKRFSL